MFPVEKVVLVFLIGPFQVLEGPIWSPQNLLQAEQPQCSHPVLTGEVPQPPDHLCSLWAHCNRTMSFLSWGHQTSMQWSRQDLTRAEQNGRITPLDITLDAAQDTFIFLAAKCTLQLHVQPLIHR